MLQENLKDAAQIVKNILIQPLSIPTLNKEISMLSAAKSFNPNDPATSDLKKMVDAFKKYSEATEALLKELELICEDLKLTK